MKEVLKRKKILDQKKSKRIDGIKRNYFSISKLSFYNITQIIKDWGHIEFWWDRYTCELTLYELFACLFEVVREPDVLVVDSCLVRC